MPTPIICADGSVRYFAQSFRHCLSKPQFQYFVTVLLALLLCLEARTLCGLHRAVRGARAYCGLSRFLSGSPWDRQALVEAWCVRFRRQLIPMVAAEQARLRAERPGYIGRGRPPSAVTRVTGYLIGDDSTMHKPKGKKMAGAGKHFSTTAGHPVWGHSMLTTLYVLMGRRCPQTPHLYRQKEVCEREGEPFRSKVDLMVKQLEDFEPVEGTQTHVLVDSWYGCKAVWKAARGRGFHITSGLKANRSIRVADPANQDKPANSQGWCWQMLSEYVAGLTEADYVLVRWPTRWPTDTDPSSHPAKAEEERERTVYAHVITTSVRKLYKCRVLVVRQNLSGPLSETRYWASSDLEAGVEQLLVHIAARWDIEVLFADCKELLGLDQYQLMSATAIERFWTLVLAAYTLLDEQRASLQAKASTSEHITIGDARREIQRVHRRCLLDWLHKQFVAGVPQEHLYNLFAA
jgi:SRSO17 transposase